MNFFSRTFLVFIAVVLTGAPGCVRYDEMIALDAAGKGTATLVFQSPKHAALPGLASQSGQSGMGVELFSEAAMRKDLPQGITLEWSQTEENETRTITATYSFDDFKALAAWAATNRRSPLNNISLLQKPGELDFSRRIAPVDEQTLAGIKAYGTDVAITFSLKGPGPLIETNATKAEGSTATWEFTAHELFSPSGRTLTARFATAAPARGYALPALAILAAAAMIALWIRKRRNGQKPEIVVRS